MKRDTKRNEIKSWEMSSTFCAVAFSRVCKVKLHESFATAAGSPSRPPPAPVRPSIRPRARRWSMLQPHRSHVVREREGRGKER